MRPSLPAYSGRLAFQGHPGHGLKKKMTQCQGHWEQMTQYTTSISMFHACNASHCLKMEKDILGNSCKINQLK